jgi:hypothetical protein
MRLGPSVDLILSLSKDEVLAGAGGSIAWFDKRTTRSGAVRRPLVA